MIGLNLRSVVRGLRTGSAIGLGFVLGQFVSEWLRYRYGIG